MQVRNRRIVGLLVSAALVLATQSLAWAQEPEAEGPPSIAVTTEILGSVVSEVAGDDAQVTVLMPSGADPHEWQPSARDAERIMEASLVVENGLALEEGLLEVLEQARAEGVPVFTASDHVTVRMNEEGHDEDHEQAAGDEDHEQEDRAHAAGEADQEHDEDGHDHGPEDPHFWLDPVAMLSVAEALVPAMADLGIDVEDRADAFVTELGALDSEIHEMVAAVPQEQRILVTGHEVLGYFADRYGLRQGGAVIPSLSTSGEPSAQDVAELIATMKEVGVSVVFTDVGTPQSIAETVAEATGAAVVPLRLEQLPPDGSYLSFMRELAQAITGALAR